MASVTRLFENTTTVGLAANTDEQVLHTFDLPAGRLANDGDAIRIRTFVQCAANANNKGMKVIFGGTTIGASTGQTFNNSGFTVDAYVFRTSATTQKALCSAHHWAFNGSWGAGDGAGFNSTTPGETLSGPVTISISGQSAVAGAADDVQVLATVIDYLTAAA